MTAAAAACAVGILGGLYRCQDNRSESLLEYSPDFPIERASAVVSRCARLGVELPVDDLAELLPEWGVVLRGGRPAR